MDSKQIEIAWQGDSWSLHVARQVLADGSTAETAYIDHPGAVVLVPYRESAGVSELLILRQYRLALRETILELPAGTRGRDEGWLECAQRELREETGYRAGRLIDLGKSWPAPGVSNEVLGIYLAMDLRPDPLPKDRDEQIEVVCLPFVDLFAMAANGQLQDAKSVVGILRTAHYLGKPPVDSGKIGDSDIE